THEIEIETIAEKLSKQDLGGMMDAKIEAGLEGLSHRRADSRVRMPIYASRIFTEEVGIGEAVDIGDDRAFTLGGANGHRPRMGAGACVAAGHQGGGALMEARRLGAPAAKLFESLGERHIPPVGNSGDDIHVRTSAINA